MQGKELLDLTSQEWNVLLLHTALVDDLSKINHLLWRRADCLVILVSFLQNMCRLHRYRELEKVFEEMNSDTPAIVYMIYLGYLKYCKKDTKTVIDAYEYSIKKCTDIHVGDMWQDYAAYIEKEAFFEENGEEKKQEYLTNIYSRAVTQPNNKIRALWNDYCEKIGDTQDLAVLYEQALEQTHKIERTEIDRSFIPSFENTQEAKIRKLGMERLAIDKQAYYKSKSIQTEKNVMEAYDRIVGTFLYWKEMYIQYSEFLLSINKIAEAKAVLQKAAVMLPVDRDVVTKTAIVMELTDKEGAAYFLKKNIDVCGVFEYISFVKRTKDIVHVHKSWKEQKERADGADYLKMAKLLYLSLNEKDKGYKVLEEGVRRYKEDSEYFCSSLVFLYESGNSNDASLLFDVIVHTSQREYVTEAWETVILYDRLYFGDANSVYMLEKRKEKDSEERKDTERQKIGREMYREKTETVTKHWVLDDLLQEQRIPLQLAEALTFLPLFSNVPEVKNKELLFKSILDFK